MSKGNFTTGAQRYNKRMDKIFENYKKNTAMRRAEDIEYLCSIGYTMPGIGTYSNEVISKLVDHHKKEIK
jgi:hypothetical protein